MYWHSGKIFSNFLKFSQIFSNFLEAGGVPDRGGLSQTFVVFDFLGEKLSNFSDSLGVHFFVLEVCWGNITPNFSKLRTDVFFFA